MSQLTRSTLLLSFAAISAMTFLLVRGLRARPPGNGPTAALAAEAPAARSVDTPAAAVPAPASTAAPTATVRGKIVDDGTGQPIAGARVLPRVGRDQPSTQTDASGTFSLAALPVGPLFRLQVDHEGDYLQEFIDVRVPRGRTQHDVGTIRLVRGDWSRRFGGGPRGMVGLENELRAGRMLVTGVRPDTPAARAGIKLNDWVVSVDGKSMDGLGHAARTYYLQGKPGSEVTLVLEGASGEKRTVVLKREVRPGRENTMPKFY